MLVVCPRSGRDRVGEQGLVVRKKKQSLLEYIMCANVANQTLTNQCHGGEWIPVHPVNLLD